MRYLCPLFTLLCVAACGDDDAQACVPGTTLACTGVGGCAGGQACNAEGTGFDACQCGSDAGVDGSPGDGSIDMSSADVSIDMSSADVPRADVSPDSPGDVGNDVGPVADCDPLAPNVCNTGHHCTWVFTMAGAEARCVPDGDVPLRGACIMPDPGPDAFDDCAAGSVCYNGTCTPLCEVGGDTCLGIEYCAQTGYFSGRETVGACIVRCNPLTNRRADGIDCPAGTGCYYDGVENFICVSAGSTPVGEVIEGDAFFNSCVPGAYASGEAMANCLPYCLAAESSVGNTTNLNGRSPFSCAEQGVAGDYECRFHPDDGHETLPENFGWCVSPSALSMPSCADLPAEDTNGDGVDEHRAAGCAPSL